MRELWAEIEALDNRVPAAVQYEMQFATARALRHATYWVLAHRGRSLEVEPAVAQLKPGLARLVAAAPKLVTGRLAARIDATRGEAIAAGVPPALATRIATLELLQSGLYIVDLAARRRMPLETVARVHLHLGTALDLDGLRLQIDALAVAGHWQSVARGSLREDLYRLHRTLTEAVLARGRQGDPVKATDAWLAARRGPVEHLRRIVADMAPAPTVDFATLSVVLQSLKRLAGE